MFLKCPSHLLARGKVIVFQEMIFWGGQFETNTGEGIGMRLLFVYYTTYTKVLPIPLGVTPRTQRELCGTGTPECRDKVESRAV